MGAGRRENCHYILLYFPRAPITNISENSPKPLFTSCLCLTFPWVPSLGFRECSGQLCWHFESLTPPFLLAISLDFFLSYTLYLHRPHSSCPTSPSLPWQVPYASLAPTRLWSRPVWPNRTFSSNVTVHRLPFRVVSLSHMWLLSTWNVASVTGLNFLLCLISVTWSSHM